MNEWINDGFPLASMVLLFFFSCIRLNFPSDPCQNRYVINSDD